MRSFKYAILIAAITISGAAAALAQGAGTISGQVVDSLGAVIVGVRIEVTDAAGNKKSTVTDNSGNFRVGNLATGPYELSAVADGFSEFKTTDIRVTDGKNVELPILLAVEGVQEEVEVGGEGFVSTDSQSNASALVLKEEDLEALPDDPDDLEQALQALAGGAAGPNGGQIYIDGFQGGNIPSKESIREIRINQNPFSAEYDRLGFGRIEILTKPGSDQFRGRAFLNFNDDAFNSRNPFSVNKADSQSKFYGASVSGPVVKDRASFFLSADNRDIRSGSIVNATTIGPGFEVVPFQQEFSVPQKRFSINPRFDYKINENNTLILRYELEKRTGKNQGIGEFTLPSRAIETENTEHTFQLTETAVVNAKTINETRFQYRSDNRERFGDSTQPSIDVLSAFNGGGSNTGLNYDREKTWELQNYTTTALGKDSQHAVKFGVRVRGTSLEDRSESNYNGTFTFAGFLDDAGTPNDPSDDVFVTSIEQYRQKLLGNPDPRYNPNQFRISSGNPVASIKQYDLGLFVTDDWRVSPGLTLAFGMRYENQTNISDSSNFAPRFSFAYSPGAGGSSTPKTVLRGGIGVFYTRFGENNVLTAERLDGVRQQQFVIGGNDPILSQAVFTLDGVTNVPTAQQLSNVAPLASTPRLLAGDLQAPMTIQGAFSYERQLPGRSTLSVYYVASKNQHLIRSRNINAPVCPPAFPCPRDEAALQALRPDPNSGNIYQFESSGELTQRQLIFSFRSFLSRSFTIFSSYRTGKSRSNTDGEFPFYSYDTDLDYGDSSLDRKHFFFFGGSFGLPFGGISLRPFIIAGSGRPFNITTGQDNNQDSIFNDRPTFAALSAACLSNGLTTSWCDVAGQDPDSFVPRNYGRGPSFTTVNLGIDKNFGFGGSPSADAGEQTVNRGRRGGRRGRGNVFSGGRRGGRGSGGGERKPYNLSVGLRFRNLLNTNNINSPVGNISSALFGQSTDTIGRFGRGGSSGGNRTIELRLRFQF